ncbi:hypothetical protein [Streptomyces sp. ME19-01-6]|uniref:hypothetical protein n=1 Tax=Streptomyces sp. ME19-01-6 TaxID=3028686 RepID=UPI0029B35761|nr:hypothetical protein [Streptomyces sp. ME19-01-6]MDX3229209.1 hypothetical protein [Streptomyces sp. ME19-01-6]
MLTSVATEWLWLMAVIALVIHCSAMARWVPVQKFWMVYPFIWVLCGTGAAALGVRRGFALAEMLVMCSFALIGLTIGMFPTRKLFVRWAHESNTGATRERWDYPRSHLAFCVVSVIVMLLAAMLLTR